MSKVQPHHHDPHSIISPTLDNNKSLFKSLSMLKGGNGNSLSSYDYETLKSHMEPVCEALKSIDAESLLNLQRIKQQQHQSCKNGGGGDYSASAARLRDDIYVKPIHNDIQPPPPPQPPSPPSRTPPKLIQQKCHPPPLGRLHSSSSTLDDASDNHYGDTHHSYVRYLHISEVPGKYSIGIFVFPPYAKIPLHDHPGMCVLSRLLYGDVQRLSLDLIKPSSSSTSKRQPKRSNSFLSRLMGSSSRSMSIDGDNDDDTETEEFKKKFNLPHGSKKVHQNGIEYLAAPDVAILYPFEGNLHELVAGPSGCAILDVLLPPYDIDHDRDCTFYSIYNNSSSNHNHNQKENNGCSASNTTNNGGGSDATKQQHIIKNSHGHYEEKPSCWIIPMNQPESFHCLSGKYGNIGCNDDDYDEDDDEMHYE